MLSVIMLSVIMLTVIMLSVIMLNVVFYLNMLNDIVLIVVKLYVVLPLRVRFQKCVLPKCLAFYVLKQNAV